ncbi:MAG: divalent-cation tolerance protein CutA, partial [Candidatus Caldarchaeum sp.]|nr:divalent-cation tolerance protein CutA [Candidatus Caldarchaeum sp.]
ATSFFFWEGELKKEDEVILVIKTSEEKAPELKKVVSQEHPYRVPAIIEIPVADVNSSYLRWVEEMTAR